MITVIMTFPLLLHLNDTILHLLAIQGVYSNTIFPLVILKDTAIICSIQAFRIIIHSDTHILIRPHYHIVDSLLVIFATLNQIVLIDLGDCETALTLIIAV